MNTNPNFANLAFEDPTIALPYNRSAIIGPSGSGKTWTSLAIATAMCHRVALIDTENGSGALYRNFFNYKHMNLKTHSPAAFIHAIKLSEQNGFDGLIIDSLSHAWIGTGGVLDIADNARGRYGGNAWAAWRDATPEHNALIDAIIYSNLHMFVTMRTETHWDVQKDDKGQIEPVKLGLKPRQREGLEYEMSLIMDMNMQHRLTVSKTRYFNLDSYAVIRPDGQEIAEKIVEFLESTATAYNVVEEKTEEAAFTDPADEPTIDRRAALPAESSARVETEVEATKETPASTTNQPNDVNAQSETDDLGDSIFEQTTGELPERTEDNMTKTQTVKLIQAKGATLYEDWPAQRQRLVYMLTEQRTKSITRMDDTEIGLLLEVINNREATIGKLHEIGETLYGARWPEVCRANAMKLTANRTDKIPALTDDELDQYLQAIKNMQTKAQQMTETTA
ncbi:ATP-binding protein [Chloroflexi bacterium TSY]|nr:ATP-binding protein [Chloroflexi bacterium TSY]